MCIHNCVRIDTSQTQNSPAEVVNNNVCAKKPKTNRMHAQNKIYQTIDMEENVSASV